jgi:TolB-like protein/Tfp pilus assembly protein PilF/tRNA A-37 threonylcarbamoyl transferase component Bud32
MLSRYLLIEKIGQGGMGIVYKALDTSLDRHVAIKVLPPELTTDPERRQRFLNEARLAAAVTHPNISTIHEVGESDGAIFIAMELVEGRSLRSVIGDRGMAPDQALRIGLQIAEGLARAHQRGIVHRDLKPDNVLIETDGRAKILDFGLAKLREPDVDPRSITQAATRPPQLTAEGRIMGTPSYMSPEQARGETVDARSDIFSFGSVLYEMLTGRQAFPGNGPLTILTGILRDEPAAPSRLNPDVPRALDAVLARCMRKDASARYGTGQELLEALRAIAPAGTAAGHRAFHPRALPAFIAVVVVVAMAGTGSFLFLRSRGSSAPAGVRSLAVLPLENLSGDAEQEYFADGMTDELIGSLSRIGNLRVISRTSSMAYKGKRKPLPQIAAELAVDSVVEGTVLLHEGRVRVSAQLIDAAHDRSLWSETYERDARDVLSLQTEVAHAIAREVRGVLTPRERTLLDGGARPVDPAAHEAYLKGRFFWNRRSAPGMKQAIELFQEALSLDPEYAPAYAGLADCYNLMTDYDAMPAREAFPKAMQYARKALALDANLAEAHNALAYAIFRFEWDWDAAEREFQAAIDLSPGYVTARYWYAELLVLLGRFEEGLAEARRALELDPLSLPINTNLAWFHYLARDNASAQDRLGRALALDRGFPMAHFVMGELHMAAGRYPDAVREFQLYGELSADSKNVLGIGLAHALAGRRDEAMKMVEAMKARPDAPASGLGILLGALHQNDEAFQWLGRALAQRDDVLVYVKVHPFFDPLRTDPRFADLVRRVGLDTPGLSP